jgi:hypothetical protein
MQAPLIGGLRRMAALPLNHGICNASARPPARIFFSQFDSGCSKVTKLKQDNTDARFKTINRGR